MQAQVAKALVVFFALLLIAGYSSFAARAAVSNDGFEDFTNRTQLDARPERELRDVAGPSFSNTTRTFVSIGAVLGALKLEGGLIWCILFLVERSRTLPGRAARIISAISASGAAFVAMAFISLDSLLTSIFLVQAWRSPLALLFVVIAGALASYWGARGLIALTEELEGTRVEVMVIAAISFLASVIAHSLFNVFLSSVNPASFMFSYILIGALGGILVFIIRILIREDERLTHKPR